MFYVLDGNNNKVEAFDKQGVLAILEQAIEEGTLENIMADSAFVTKLKCCVGTGTHQIAFVPQSTYNELAANNQLIEDAYYFITDDTTAEDITAQLEELTNAVNGLNTIVTSLETKTNREIKSETSLISIAVEFGKTYVFIIKNTTFIVALPNDITLAEMSYSETDNEYTYIINSNISYDDYYLQCVIYKDANGVFQSSASRFKLMKGQVSQTTNKFYYYKEL